MQIEVRVNTRDLENKLHVLAKEARVAPGLVIKEETKLLTRNIIQLTPPKSLAQGRAAVAKDIGNVVVPLDPEKTRWPALQRAIARKDLALIRLLLSRSKTKPRFTEGQEIRPEHIQRRNRYGRVRGRAQLTSFVSPAKKYLTGVQAWVGWAKSAWVPALLAAGGSAPSWIARHAAVAGRVFANFGENPRVTATAVNIKIPNYQRQVDSALRNRERVTQTKINRVMAGKATNLGFTVIEGR